MDGRSRRARAATSVAVAALAVTVVVPAGASEATSTVVAASAPGHDRVTIVVDGELDDVTGLGDVVDRQRVPALGIERLAVPSRAADRVLETLRARGATARVDPVLEVTRTPDDPLYPSQSEYDQIRAPRAWDRTVGSSSTIVAVLDTGVDASHPDLAGALVGGYDFVERDSSPHDDDPGGHGTAVAGIVAARSDNGIGVASTCWRCRVMPVKVLAADGTGYSSVIAEGIVHAADRGADVINLSLAGGVSDPAMLDAIRYATARDVLVVGAAGNANSTSRTYPAAYDEVLGVAASDGDDTRSSFSNHGQWVSVTAPGCTSTTASHGGRLGYWRRSFCGTSAATPMVAGLAGLIRSIRPDLSADEVTELIEAGSVPVGYVEHGRIDASASVPLSGDPAAGSGYHALTPTRLLDTRTSTGGNRGLVQGGETIRLDVAGRGGVPDVGVTAVVLNVTVTGPSAASYLTVFPAATRRPTASTVNFGPGQTVPNLTTVQLGADGAVDVFNYVGTTHVVVDVAGYYTTSPAGAEYTSLDPARVLDTRTGTGGRSTSLGPDESMLLQVTGRGGVPTTGVTAVAVNLTATDATRDTYLNVHPSGTARPTTSTVNVGRGEDAPNMAIAGIGDDGRIRIHNFAGHTHVLVDVVGYYSTTAGGGRFHALPPTRAVDTRTGLGGPRSALGHRPVRTVDLTGVAGVPYAGVSAVVTNVTGVRPTATATYLSLYPAGTGRPTVSNLNLVRGDIAANMAVPKVGPGGEVAVYNDSGTVDLVIDVAGYFSLD